MRWLCGLCRCGRIPVVGHYSPTVSIGLGRDGLSTSTRGGGGRENARECAPCQRHTHHSESGVCHSRRRTRLHKLADSGACRLPSGAVMAHLECEAPTCSRSTLIRMVASRIWLSVPTSIKRKQTHRTGRMSACRVGGAAISTKRPRMRRRQDAGRWMPLASRCRLAL